jgi:hypothetical protein
MKIRIKVNQSADHSPCAHRVLTLKGIDLTRSRERYICNACGKPVVRTLNTSVLASGHQAPVTTPSDTGD